MTLREWIDSVGGYKEAAVVLQMKTDTVRSWYEKKRRPRITQAVRIIDAAEGSLDFNGIYGSLTVLKGVRH